MEAPPAVPMLTGATILAFAIPTDVGWNIAIVHQESSSGQTIFNYKERALLHDLGVPSNSSRLTFWRSLSDNPRNLSLAKRLNLSPQPLNPTQAQIEFFPDGSGYAWTSGLFNDPKPGLDTVKFTSFLTNSTVEFDHFVEPGPWTVDFVNLRLYHVGDKGSGWLRTDQIPQSDFKTSCQKYRNDSTRIALHADFQTKRMFVLSKIENQTQDSLVTWDTSFEDKLVNTLFPGTAEDQEAVTHMLLAKIGKLQHFNTTIYGTAKTVEARFVRLEESAHAFDVCADNDVRNSGGGTCIPLGQKPMYFCAGSSTMTNGPCEKLRTNNDVKLRFVWFKPTSEGWAISVFNTKKHELQNYQDFSKSYVEYLQEPKYFDGSEFSGTLTQAEENDDDSDYLYEQTSQAVPASLQLAQNATLRLMPHLNGFIWTGEKTNPLMITTYTFHDNRTMEWLDLSQFGYVISWDIDWTRRTLYILTDAEIAAVEISDDGGKLQMKQPLAYVRNCTTRNFVIVDLSGSRFKLETDSDKRLVLSLSVDPTDHRLYLLSSTSVNIMYDTCNGTWTRTFVTAKADHFKANVIQGNAVGIWNDIHLRYYSYAGNYEEALDWNVHINATIHLYKTERRYKNLCAESNCSHVCLALQKPLCLCPYGWSIVDEKHCFNRTKLATLFVHTEPSFSETSIETRALALQHQQPLLLKCQLPKFVPTEKTVYKITCAKPALLETFPLENQTLIYIHTSFDGCGLGCRAVENETLFQSTSVQIQVPPQEAPQSHQIHTASSIPGKTKIWYRNNASFNHSQGYSFSESRDILSSAVNSFGIYFIRFTPPEINFYKEENKSSDPTVIALPQTATMKNVKFASIRASPSQPQVVWTHSPGGHLWLTNVETSSSVPLKNDFFVIDMDVDWDRQMVFGVSELNCNRIIVLDLKFAIPKESKLFAGQNISSIGVISNGSNTQIYYLTVSGRICRQTYGNAPKEREVEVIPAILFNSVRRKSLVVQVDRISWIGEYFSQVSFVETLMTNEISARIISRYFIGDFVNALVKNTSATSQISELQRRSCGQISLLNGTCACPWSSSAAKCGLLWIHIAVFHGNRLKSQVFTFPSYNLLYPIMNTIPEDTAIDLVPVDGAGDKYCYVSNSIMKQTQLLCYPSTSKYNISGASKILQTFSLDNKTGMNIVSLNDNCVQIHNMNKKTSWTIFCGEINSMATNVVVDIKNWILFYENKASIVEMAELGSLVVRPFLKDFSLDKVVPDRLTLDSNSNFLYWIHGPNQREILGRNYANWNVSTSIKFWENDVGIGILKLQFFNGFLYWIERTSDQTRDQLILFNIEYRSKQVFVKHPILSSISSFILQSGELPPEVLNRSETGIRCSHFYRRPLSESSNRFSCWCPHEKPLLASNGVNCTHPALYFVTSTSSPKVFEVKKFSQNTNATTLRIKALDQPSVFGINEKAYCWLSFPEKHLKCRLFANPSEIHSFSSINIQNPTFSLNPTSDLVIYNTGNETTETFGCLTLANITSGHNLSFPCIKEEEGAQFAFDHRRKLAVWCSSRDRRIKFHPLNGQYINSYEPSFEEGWCSQDAGNCTSLALDPTTGQAYFIHGKQIRCLDYASKKSKPPLNTLHRMTYIYAHSLTFDGDDHLFWVGGFSSSGEFVDMITIPANLRDSVASIRVLRGDNFKIVQVHAELEIRKPKLNSAAAQKTCNSLNCQDFCFPDPENWWTLKKSKCYCSDQQTDYTHCSKLVDPSAALQKNLIQHLAESLEPPQDFKIVMIIISVSASLIIIALAIVAVRFRRRQTFQEENYKRALEVFLEGDEDSARQTENAAEKSYYVPFTMVIPPEDIDFHEAKQLGSGQFGAVFLAKYKNEPAAIKMVKSGKDKDQMMEFLKEIKIMAYIGEHAHIVQMYGAVTQSLAEGSVLVVLELCSQGDLESYLRKHKADYIVGQETENSIMNSSSETISFHNLVGWSRQIAQGLAYLQEKQVVHGDLATRNVLLFDDDLVKVSDFGFSRKTYGKQYTKSNKYTPLPFRWAAPETLDQMVFSSKTDVWSYGVTVWEIFTLGNCPFVKETWDLTFSARLKEGMRLEKPELATREIYDRLMMHCWQINPEDRPDFQQICGFWDALIVGKNGGQGPKYGGHSRALPNTYQLGQ